MAMRKEWAVLVYVAITALISSIFYALIIGGGMAGGAGKFYVGGLMWSPAVAAFLTVHLCGLDPKSLGLHWGGNRYALIGYLTPLGYATIAYVLVWVLGFGVFADAASVEGLAKRLGWSITSPAAFVPLYFLMTATLALISGVAHALGEEIGWRGFLTPQLVARFGFTGGSIVTGIIWTTWHLPLLFWAGYNGGTPWWYSMPCFLVMVIALSFMLTWLRLKSDSVWPCAIFHASHNMFIQAFFTPITGARGDITPYAIDEFGFAVPIVAAAFAFFFWTRWRKAGETPGNPLRTPA